MHKVTRTVYSLMLECVKEVGVPFQVLPGSTLNEKHDIDVFSDEYPTVQYFGLGLDYHDMVSDGDLDFTDPLHGAIDADTFRPIPLIVRPTSIGLTDEEMLRYRIRVVEVIDGIEYIVCYLKKLDSIAPYSGVYEISHEEDNTYLDAINLREHHALNPVPKFRDCNDDIKFVTFDMKVKILMSKAEIIELKNAIAIKYRGVTEDYVKSIGEVALFQGVEKTEGDTTEAASVQAAYFSRVRRVIPEKFAYTMDLGGMTPYYI